MNRIVKRWTPSIAVLILFGGAIGRADAIRPWSGASASVHVFDPNPPTSSQVGATAQASVSRPQEVRYYGGIDTDYNNPYRITVSGSASAAATGRANDLLQVDASYQSGNPGTTPRPVDGTQLDVGGQASWTGDRLTVAASPGAALPGTVRLNFALDVSSLQFSDYNQGFLSLSANGQGASFGFHALSHAFGYYPGPDDVLSLFDTFSRKTDSLGFTSGYLATFHIDLPVNRAGVSDPFSLGLDASPATGMTSNQNLRDSFRSAISLTSITTTDGRLLSDLGDSVTFASGMLAPGVQPSPVPEPSSILVLGGLVAVIGLGRRFGFPRRRAAGAFRASRVRPG